MHAHTLFSKQEEYTLHSHYLANQILKVNETSAACWAGWCSVFMCVSAQEISEMDQNQINDKEGKENQQWDRQIWKCFYTVCNPEVSVDSLSETGLYINTNPGLTLWTKMLIGYSMMQVLPECCVNGVNTWTQEANYLKGCCHYASDALHLYIGSLVTKTMLI